MEEGKFSQAEYSEDSVFSDSDLTNQLRDKIRTQAQRLRSLEQYRVICEQRIQELQPGHPMPVKKEHLGLAGSAIQELKLAKEKITRLESQVSQLNIETEEGKDCSDYILLLEKYNELLKDKNDLEESLRAEMLNSEEQRTYIEMLKQVINSKFEEFNGLPFEHKPYSNAAHLKPRDETKDYSKLRSTLTEYENQLKKIQNQIRNRENENEMLTKERQELDSHLRQAAEALQIAEEEVSRLEEEKISLLEYVDQHTTKEREMERELNDLSKYFEEMKKDFNETLSSLEDTKAAYKKLEAENETYSNDLSNSNRLIEDLQASLELLKSDVGEKETLIKSLKESKANSEIKIEKLQSNITSLTETLTETQKNAENLKEILDSTSKQDDQKIENFNRLKSENSFLSKENLSSKEKIMSLVKDFEFEKKTRIELERIRELDIKQIQDLRSRLLDSQAKCEILENLKKSRAETEQQRKTDMVRIAKLEDDLNYFQENYRQTQQNEYIQTKNINELKKQNSQLALEIEEVCVENENIKAELIKKNKELEVYLNKYRNLNDFCQNLENHKAELEEMIETEKSNHETLKEEVFKDKNRIDELLRSLQESNKTTENYEKFVKEKEEETKSLKAQLKSSEKDLEEEKKSKNKLVSDLKDTKTKLQAAEHDLEKITTEITNSCKVISAFCGKYAISYNDYKSCLSLKYKNFLETWKEGSGSNLECINSWISTSIEELETLAKTIFSTNKDLKATSLELSKTLSKFEDANSGEIVYKQHATKLKIELDEVYKKNEILLEQSEEEISRLNHEIAKLKNEISGLTGEKFSLTEALKSALSENQNIKSKTDYGKPYRKTYEDRLSMSSQKNKTEFSGSPNKNSGYYDMSRLSNEISRITSDLELSEREKYYIENQLERLESDPRTKDSDKYLELCRQLEDCEKQIKSYKKNILALKEDFLREEKIPDTRLSEKPKRDYLGMVNSSSNIGLYGYSNYTDRSLNSRSKSRYT